MKQLSDKPIEPIHKAIKAVTAETQSDLRTVLVTAFTNRSRKPNPKTAASFTKDQATRPHRDIGPIGTAARLVVGLLLVGSIVYGQLSSSGHLSPSTWVLGLIGFPALVLAWHFWRI